jgi:hypothetical protein
MKIQIPYQFEVTSVLVRNKGFHDGGLPYELSVTTDLFTWTFIMDFTTHNIGTSIELLLTNIKYVLVNPETIGLNGPFHEGPVTGNINCDCLIERLPFSIESIRMWP